MGNSIEETINRARVLIDEQRWPRYTLTLNPDDAIVEIERMAKLNRFPFDHIVASGETLVAIAKHVAGPEEAERLRLEIEALERATTEEEDEGLWASSHSATKKTWCGSIANRQATWACRRAWAR